MRRGRANIAATFGAAVTVLAVVFAFAAPALAAGAPASTNAAELTNEGLRDTAVKAGLGTTARPLTEILGTLIYAALSLLGVIFVILMIYAGFLWMQARGNTEDAEKAKKIIEHAIIGIILIGLAFAITTFVISQVGGATQG